MTLGAIGLASDDPCYDPNHPWYDWGLQSIFNTPAECQCLIDSGRPLGDQCWTAAGVTQTMAGTAGGIVAAGANAVGEGIGTGVASSLSSFGSTIDFTGLVMLGVAGVIAYALLSKR